MKLFGHQFGFSRAPKVIVDAQLVDEAKAVPNNLSTVQPQSLWWPFWGTIKESFTGAWQQNVTLAPTQTVLAFSAVYACVAGISRDIAKLRIKLTENHDGIWEEITKGSPWLPVLRKPNHYQTRIKFIEQWMVSLLLYGNTYILKQRDQRGIVTQLYILHPNCVKTLVAESGDVFYQIDRDDLSGVHTTITVPASEIIHDMMVSLFHPLVGVSPIYACGMSAMLGNKIQLNSNTLFGNKSQPGGMLSAPGHISDSTAARLKAYWEANFTGSNVGKIAVAGDGLKYEQFTMTAVDAQLIQQLRWTVDDVARAFHYPMWKLGGPMPPYSGGPQILTTIYYTDTLQNNIEAIELCLDEGLSLPTDMGTELDIDNLMRMDTTSLFESNNKGSGWMKINEMRFRANLPPTEGGDSPYLQQQNFSLEALAKRDAQEDPFSTSTATPEPAQPPETEPAAEEPTPKSIFDNPEELEAELRKELALV